MKTKMMKIENDFNDFNRDHTVIEVVKEPLYHHEYHKELNKLIHVSKHLRENEKSQEHYIDLHKGIVELKVYYNENMKTRAEFIENIKQKISSNIKTTHEKAKLKISDLKAVNKVYKQECIEIEILNDHASLEICKHA